MRIYKRIIVVLAVVLATIIINLWDCNNPQIQTAFFNPIQQVEFVELRKCANKSALNENLEEIENINIEKSIENGQILVKVENKKRFIELNATYPIKNYEIDTENNNIEIQGTIDFENAIYENKSKVYNPFIYIVTDIIIFVYIIFLTYSLLYTFPEMIIDYVKFCRKHKKE